MTDDDGIAEAIADLRAIIARLETAGDPEGHLSQARRTLGRLLELPARRGSQPEQ
jgi:hypothetical protein